MMSSGAIQEYVGAIQRRYDAASSRREKSEILDEICRTSGVHRKHALRLLRKARQPGLGDHPNPAIEDHRKTGQRVLG